MAPCLQLSGSPVGVSFSLNKMVNELNRSVGGHSHSAVLLRCRGSVEPDLSETPLSK